MNLRSRPKILAVAYDGSGYVVRPPESSRALSWSTDHAMPAIYSSMSMVGTCNGLVCLCDDSKPGGAIVVTNPWTGQTLDVPPLPLSDAAVRLQRDSGRTRKWHQTYMLARHSTTGRYKIVHVPSHFDRFWEPGAVHVFTLGEASWREVQAGPDARCVHGAHRLAEVDGTVYWVAETEDAIKIMSLDLEDDSVTPTEPLPEDAAAEPGNCFLTKVHGRLGIAIRCDNLVMVWVLQGKRWRPWLVHDQGQGSHRLWQQVNWDLVVPHFAHGDHILMHGDSKMYGHKVSAAERLPGCGTLLIRHGGLDKEICSLPCLFDRMFAYIETKESLSEYKAAGIAW